MGPASRTVAATAFALTVVLSYAGQLAWSLGSQPDPAQVWAVQHVPFTWRTWLALLHGATVAGCSLALGESRASRVLDGLPWVVMLSAGIAALAAVVWPA